MGPPTGQTLSLVQMGSVLSCALWSHRTSSPATQGTRHSAAFLLNENCQSEAPISSLIDLRSLMRLVRNFLATQSRERTEAHSRVNAATTGSGIGSSLLSSLRRHWSQTTVNDVLFRHREVASQQEPKRSCAPQPACN